MDKREESMDIKKNRNKWGLIHHMQCQKIQQKVMSEKAAKKKFSAQLKFLFLSKADISKDILF